MLKLRADHAVGGRVAAKGHEIVVDRNNGLAVANQQTLDRGIGEAAHPVGLELLAPPVAQVERDAAERESNDDKARQRHRRPRATPTAMPMPTGQS